MIRAVIFDLDGVLVSTDEFHYQAWKTIADGESIPFDREFNHRLRGVGRMQSLEIILERASRPYSEAEKEVLAARKNARYVELLGALTPRDVLPGVLRILDELNARRIVTAVATVSRNAQTILTRTDLAHRFDAIVDGHAITRSKPDPQVFTLAAQRLGVDCANCLVIEDAMAGIEGARRAGMAVLGIGTPQSLPGVEPIAPGLDAIAIEDLL